MADSVGRASILYFLKGWVMIPIAIVSSILTARVLGPEVKGLFTLFLTTQGILLLPGAAISAALIHFVASRRPAPGKLKTLISLLVLIQAVVSVGALALLIQIRGVRIVLLGGLDSIYLLAVFMVVCANLWLTYRLAILSGLQMYSKSVVLGTTATIVNSILFICVVAYWWIEKVNPPLNWVVILSVSASLFSAALLGIGATHVKHMEGAVLGSRTILMALGSFAAPVFLRGLIEWVNLRVDVYFVYAFTGARELGVYTVAVGLAQQLWLIPIALSGPLFARVSQEGDGPRSRELIQYAFRTTSLISVTLGLCLAIVAPVLLPIAFGGPFSGAVLLFLVLLPGAIALGPTRIIISYFSGRGRPRESLKAESLGLGATITLDILLIPSLGALGAACASCVAYILYSVYVCRRFVALTGSRWSELLVPRRDDLRKMWRGLGDQKRSIERSRSAARLFSFLGFKRA